MNFFRRKNRRTTTLTISDQTKSSRGSLSSGDGRSSAHASTSTLGRHDVARDDLQDEKAVSLQEGEGTLKHERKIKHARFLDDTNANNNSSSLTLHDQGKTNGMYVGMDQTQDMGMLNHPNANLVQDMPVEGPSVGAPLSLYASIIKGDKAELKKIITGNIALLDTADNFGRTPLMYCVLANRLDCAKYLINMGCNLDQVDNAGRSATHSAAHKGSYKFLELLNNRGASLDIKDNDGQTPLHLATRIRTPKCLEFLLRNLGPGMVDVPDNQMRTALHWSAAFNNTESVKLLIKYGINIALTDNECKTPLHWAANNHDPSTVHTMEALLEKSPGVLNWQDSEGRTALHFAVAHGNSVAVEFLVNFKAVEYSEPFECDPDRSDYTYRTPLHWAAQLGHTHIVKLLLQGNAKNSSSDGNGATPFLYAALTDKQSVVEAMIEYDGKVVDQVDIEGRNALMWAAGKGSDSVIRILLGIKKPVPSEENKKNTEDGQSSTDTTDKPQLIFTPVDVNKQDNKGNTALHVAARNGHGSSVELLLRQGAKHEMENTDTHHTPIFGACEKGHVNCVKYLLDYRASVHLMDSENKTPLHWAALGGHAEVCELLINEGLDVDVRDKLERTPLHCAAFGGFINCMNLLLENDANVDLQDQEGRSALHWAAQSSHLDAIILLFQYSVFPNPMEYTEERLTPLDHALQKENEDVMHYLIEQGALSAEHIRNIAAMRIQAYYRGHKVRKGKDILMKTLLLRKEKREKIEAEEKSAEQIRVTAATKIQACYRGYKTRKSLPVIEARDTRQESQTETKQEVVEKQKTQEDKENIDEKPDIDSGSHSPEHDQDPNNLLSDSPDVIKQNVVDSIVVSHDEGVICDQASVASSHSATQFDSRDKETEEKDENDNKKLADTVEIEQGAMDSDDEQKIKEELAKLSQKQETASPPVTPAVLSTQPTTAAESDMTKTKRRKSRKERSKLRSKPRIADSDSSRDVRRPHRRRLSPASSSPLSLRSESSTRRGIQKTVKSSPQKGMKFQPVRPNQPKDVKPKKKRLLVLKEKNSCPTEYPALDKIGDVNNIQIDSVKGIAYKSQSAEPDLQDGLTRLPDCLINIPSKLLNLSEYIESLMTMSPAEKKLLNDHQSKRRQAFKTANYAATIIQKTWLSYLQKRNPSLHRKFAISRKKALKFKTAKQAKSSPEDKTEPYSKQETVPPLSQFEDDSPVQLDSLNSRLSPKRNTAQSVASSSVVSACRSPRSEALRSSLMSSSDIGSGSTTRKSSKTRRPNTSHQGNVYVSLEKLEELSRIYGNQSLLRDILSLKSKSGTSLPSIASSRSYAKRPVTAAETPKHVFESSLKGTSAYTQPKTAMHSPRVWSGFPGVQKQTRLTATPTSRNHPRSKSGPSTPDYRLMPLQWQKLYGELQGAKTADAKRKHATRYSYNIGDI